MTRAPASASRHEHIGAATACSSDTTRRPARGFVDTSILFRGSAATFPSPSSGRDSTSTPDLIGELDDHRELRPLLRLGERVAVFGGGETALRRQAELVDIDELRRLLDAALEL